MKRLLFLSDAHCGHKVGWTPPAWQTKSKEKWAGIASMVWDYVYMSIARYKPFDIVFVCGDLIEGKGEKSGSTENITSDRIEQGKIFADAVETCDCNTIRAVYGTAYHSGATEDLEDFAISELKTRGYNAKIEGHGFYTVEGVNIDMKHHISGSSVHHGVATPLLKEIDANKWWHMQGVEPKAGLLVRGHTHSALISQHDGTWGIICPALQGLGSKYARRLNKVVHVGVVVVDVDNGKVTHIEPLFVPGTVQKSTVETL